MSKPPITAAPTDTLRAVQHLMKARRISGVPISDGGELLGLISIEDIIRALDKGYINDCAEQHMARNVITLRDHYSLCAPWPSSTDMSSAGFRCSMETTGWLASSPAATSRTA